MLRVIFLLVALGIFTSAARAAERSVVVERVGVGETSLLNVPGLARVSVSNGNVKVKTIPPHQVLLFGKKEGTALLTLWRTSGESEVREVQVNAAPRGDPTQGSARLIKVLLELIEFDGRRLEELGVRWPAGQSFSLALGEIDLPRGSWTASASLSPLRGKLFHYAQKGAARLLTSPELYVREGEEAVFHSGGEFPVSSTTETIGNIRRQIDWKSFGVKIRIRPRSADGFHISSDVEVEISELNSGLAVDGVPSVTKRSIKTKVDASDNETLLLSGLHRSRDGKEIESVPILQQFPIVGPLFSMRRKESESTELIMAMTLSFAGSGGARRAESFRQRWQADGD